jgi:pyruvate/2-oxoglutarate/acetoin dehydrogenase E1 component
VAEITLIDALRQAMDEELARDESVFILGEDVGPRGGVFRATMGLYE